MTDRRLERLALASAVIAAALAVLALRRLATTGDPFWFVIMAGDLAVVAILVTAFRRR